MIAIEVDVLANKSLFLTSLQLGSGLQRTSLGSILRTDCGPVEFVSFVKDFSRSSYRLLTGPRA